MIIKQYEDIIRFLKENGALLNTIRPWYLLSYSEYHMYLNQTMANFPNSNLKINE